MPVPISFCNTDRAMLSVPMSGLPHTDRPEQENSKGLGTSLDYYYFLQFKITHIYLFSVYMHIKRSENTWGSKFVSFYCVGARHWTQATRLGSQHHSATLPVQPLLIYRFYFSVFLFFFSSSQTVPRFIKDTANKPSYYLSQGRKSFMVNKNCQIPFLYGLPKSGSCTSLHSMPRTAGRA